MDLGLSGLCTSQRQVRENAANYSLFISSFYVIIVLIITFTIHCCYCTVATRPYYDFAVTRKKLTR
jgi:hypothetical protein